MLLIRAFAIVVVMCVGQSLTKTTTAAAESAKSAQLQHSTRKGQTFKVRECAGSTSQGPKSKRIEISKKYTFQNVPIQFSVIRNPKPLICPSSTSPLKIKPHRGVGFKASYDSGQEKSVTFVFLPKGDLQVFDEDNEFGMVYGSDEYCLSRDSRNTNEIQICAFPCSDAQTESNGTSPICIRKCCPPGYAVDYISSEKMNLTVRCEPSGSVEWKPTFHKASTLRETCIAPSLEALRYRIMNPRRYCSNSDYLPRLTLNHGDYLPTPRFSWRLLDTGEVVERRPRSPLKLGERWQPANYFCMDGIQNFGKSKQLEESLHHQLLIDCSFEESNDLTYSTNETEMEVEAVGTTTVDNKVTAILRIVIFYCSIPFLALTLYSYWVDRGSQTIHGWIVAAHVLSHLIWNIFMGIGDLMSLLSYSSKEEGFCKFVGILAHFFFLTTIFWLTSVNIDLWLTFRQVRPSVIREKQVQKFVAYATFSIASPLLIIIVGLTLDGLYGTDWGYDTDCDVITPDYGVEKCYLSKYAEGVYLYFILGFLLLLNLVLFVFLLKALYHHKRSTSAIVSKGSNAVSMVSTELIIKLFVVMGASYGLEFIFWCIEADAIEKGVSIFWIITDLLNFLIRPILVFYILGWKKRWCKICLKKFWFPSADDRGDSTQQTSSTNAMRLTTR